MEGKLFSVKRPNFQYEEVGYNRIICCASNADHALEMVFNEYGNSIAWDIKKQELIVEEIENIKVGDIIACE